MKLVLIGLAFVITYTSAQIYTVAGPDGYKYAKPQSKFDAPAPAVDVQSDYLPPPLPEIPDVEIKSDVDIPPLPAFIPPINLPKVIPVTTTKSPNEYLPPIDARSGFLPTFEEWKAKYGKRYDSQEEDDKRHAIYDDNVLSIISINKNLELGVSSIETDVNKYADLTSSEFVESQCGLRRNARSIQAGSNIMNLFMPSPMLEAMADEEVDWREKGAVTAVKNQGKCASCWAFAAAGAIESHNFLRTGDLVTLSEQNLIDCVSDNNGCLGGYMTNAYQYVRNNPGINLESAYPYEADNTTCRFDSSAVGSEVMTYMEIMPGSEVALKQAVATVGPVSAGIDGSNPSFQFYKSGFYYEPNCSQDVNHAILIVGYGKTEDGQEYWICKNSWDSDWGEGGYIRMARNKNNNCGIASLASYPLL